MLQIQPATAAAYFILRVLIALRNPRKRGFEGRRLEGIRRAICREMSGKYRITHCTLNCGAIPAPEVRPATAALKALHGDHAQQRIERVSRIGKANVMPTTVGTAGKGPRLGRHFLGGWHTRLGVLWHAISRFVLTLFPRDGFRGSKHLTPFPECRKGNFAASGVI